MLTPVTELVFLQSIGVTIQMHRSQIYEFSKAMYEHGYFEQYESASGRLFYAPKHQSFHFLRQYYKNKKTGKTAKYSWHPQDRHPGLSNHASIVGIDLSSHYGDSAAHSQIPV